MDDLKIAVPSLGEGGLEAERSGHFGHCDAFTLIEVKNGAVTAVNVIPNQEHQEGGCLVPVNLLAAHKVNALIAGGMGLRPLLGFQEAGIDVYYDPEHIKVGEALDSFLMNKLEKMTENLVCGGGHPH